MNENENFKAVPKTNTYKEPKVKVGFGKSVLLPFFSGIVGCTVVLGTCFGIPSIRNKILESNPNTSATLNNNSQASGYVSQTSLSNYSDTAVYAANKVLPSIVGISVEYNVNSLVSMFGIQPQTNTAKANGSGIIISNNVIF